MEMTYTDAAGIDKSRTFARLATLRTILPARVMKTLWFRLLTGPGHTVAIARSAALRGTGRLAIDSGFEVREGTIFESDADIAFGKNVFVNSFCFIFARSGGRLAVGENVLMSPYSSIDASGGVTIGADTLIGPGARIVSANHGTAAGLPYREQESVSKPITIGRNVWLGSNVVIMPGVTVGDDAIVGAGAVVTKDVPAASLATGVPATSRPRRES
jgi:acetyltransferase-like isoleucine patch superfamily enzyme